MGSPSEERFAGEAAHPSGPVSIAARLAANPDPVGGGSRRAAPLSSWTRLGRSLALPGSGSSPLAGNPGGLHARVAWTGAIGSRWVQLEQDGDLIRAETVFPQEDWSWLTNYLQLEVELDHILQTFPPDPPLSQAVTACRGLRLLRQDPWECLASFILSSTKQIAQIRQIVATLCARFGEPVAVPAGVAPAWGFPSAARLAACTEAELRSCKAGFRAPYLLGAARAVAEGRVQLAGLSRMPLDEARGRLMSLPGVGRKIADCVLLFAGGFSRAFPMDIWVPRALRELYPRCRRMPPRRLVAFCECHFGSHAGYAQQYLFHFRRTKMSDEAASLARLERAGSLPTRRL